MTPKYTWKESHSTVIDYYKEFIKTHDMNKVIIGGDSAGGGFVLSLLQQVVELKLRLPIKMVLMSPYVDIEGDIDRDDDSMLKINHFLFLERLGLMIYLLKILEYHLYMVI